MKIPLVFGRPIQGVPSVLAVTVQPGAKIVTAAPAVAIFPPRNLLPRQTRGLPHHSATIPPPSTGNPEFSSFKRWEIIDLETLTSLGRYPMHGPLRSHDLSGRGDLLADSHRAREPSQNMAMHLSKYGGMVLRLSGLAKCEEPMENPIFDAPQAIFQRPMRCNWRGKRSWE